jgi:pilus assembly protein Flp/PilA
MLITVAVRDSSNEMPKGLFDMAFIRTTIRDSRGATAIEYGLIAALIAVAAIGAMSTLGGKLKSTFNNVSRQL